MEKNEPKSDKDWFGCFLAKGLVQYMVPDRRFNMWQPLDGYVLLRIKPLKFVRHRVYYSWTKRNQTARHLHADCPILIDDGGIQWSRSIDELTGTANRDTFGLAYPYAYPMFNREDRVTIVKNVPITRQIIEYAVWEYRQKDKETNPIYYVWGDQLYHMGSKTPVSFRWRVNPLFDDKFDRDTVDLTEDIAIMKELEGCYDVANS